VTHRAAVKTSNPIRSPPTGQVRYSTGDGGQRGLTGGDDDESTVRAVPASEGTVRSKKVR
jgi:hypothetical protein